MRALRWVFATSTLIVSFYGWIRPLAASPTVFVAGQTSTLVVCVSNENAWSRRNLRPRQVRHRLDAASAAVTATGSVEVASSTFSDSDFTVALNEAAMGWTGKFVPGP